MADVISALVATVFVVIVFRKRLAPLFGGSKRKEKAEPAGETAAAVTGPVQEDAGNVYVNVCTVDTKIYPSIRDLSAAIETVLHDQLARIYNDCVGSFTGLDVIDADGILIFLIRWHT